VIDPLAFFEILSKIEPARVDATVYGRCRAAEAQLRRREYWSALQQAQAAVTLATRASDPITIGVAFLFRAVIAHSSDIKADRDRAPLDGAAAIKWLRRDGHHNALAELIQARILLEQSQARSSIEHYRRAARLLRALVRLWHVRGNSAREREYHQLEQAAQVMVSRIQIEVRPREGTLQPDVEPPYPVDQPKPMRLPLPTYLVWPPTSAPFGLEYDSIYVDASLSSIELSHVTFNGATYLVQPIDFPGLQKLPRLLPQQQYFALQLLTPNETGLPSPCYVLVRFQSQPENREQIIAVTDASRSEAWLMINEQERLRIMGGAIREEWNKWGRKALQDDAPEDGSLYCIGIVEALLTPIAE
jgi:hypothetical protein